MTNPTDKTVPTPMPQNSSRRIKAPQKPDKEALHPAYVLHSRNYRETSLIVEFFTEEYGRVSAVLRGARGKKNAGKSRSKPSTGQIAQPFSPVLISWFGNGSLKTIKKIEPAATGFALKANRLFSGFYINELLTRLITAQDPHPNLYQQYQTLLLELAGTNDLEPLLRNFEILLLKEIGYGLNFQLANGEEFEPDQNYHFDQQHGFSLSKFQQGSQPRIDTFNGAMLIAIHHNDYSKPETCKAAKRLTRLALQPHLGSKPLKSRELFVSPN
ncbi:MAG: DNA repair protein RecO [Pseudomonadales bacterium]|nr:DNA repair protein RecO [Pseudomonadales bacterium]